MDEVERTKKGYEFSISKVGADEHNLYFQKKLKAILPSSLDARSFPVDRLAGWLADRDKNTLHC